MYNKLKICMMGIGLIMLGISSNYNVIAMEQINIQNDHIITQNELINKINNINSNIILNKILDDFKEEYSLNISQLLIGMKNYEPELKIKVDYILQYFSNLFECCGNSKRFLTNLENFRTNIRNILDNIYFIRNNEMEINEERHKQYVLQFCNTIIQIINDCIDRNLVQ